jgi:putative endonuclease
LLLHDSILLTSFIFSWETNDVHTALAREKQLKNWHRKWKIELIEKDNPGWEDLGIHLDPASRAG